MKPLNGKSATFDLKALHWCGDLIYCEGPLLTHYTSEDGCHYLVCWVDADESANRWLILRTSITCLRRYIAKEIPLKHIISYPADNLVWITDIDNNENQHNTQVLQPKELPEDYLPSENSYYEFETEDPMLTQDTDYVEISVPKRDRSFLYTLIHRMGWKTSLKGKVAF